VYGAVFQTCRLADFQVDFANLRPAGLEACGAADLEVCVTLNRYDAAAIILFTFMKPYYQNQPKPKTYGRLFGTIFLEASWRCKLLTIKALQSR